MKGMHNFYHKSLEDLDMLFSMVTYEMKRGVTQESQSVTPHNITYDIII